MEKYFPRIVDGLIEKRIEKTGSICIQGIKHCGKTTTAQYFSASYTDISNSNTEELANTSPSDILVGETPRVLDEWQIVPKLWDAVRAEVDERREPGQFILTGSSVPQEDGYCHSGIGRISRITMRPMSLYESGESTGKISLKSLFDGTQTGIAESDMTVRKITDLIVRGGWPFAVETEDFEGFTASDYAEGIIESEISRVDGVKRNKDSVRKVLRSLARNVSTRAAVTTIVKDAAGQDNLVSDKTVRSYLNALSRLFVTEDVPAWSPSVRSSAIIRNAPKRQFTDPSIPAALLQMNQERMLNDLNTTGFLFETLCHRDLRIYSQPINGILYHYHDSNDLEADAVIQLRDGKWGAVEIKLGASGVEKGAANLLRLKNTVDTEKVSEPSFLMVLTATGTAYRREDGVWIVPIGCLGP